MASEGIHCFHVETHDHAAASGFRASTGSVAVGEADRGRPLTGALGTGPDPWWTDPMSPTDPSPADRRIERLFSDSTGAPLSMGSAPEGAPNVVLVLLDDVGFGSFATFGGPVPTPTCDRVADAGLRYNQFHTTALCAPTRASLLTGRNHHSVHMGSITEVASSFPGYDSVLPDEAATIAEVLRRNGYATGMFGKGHLTPVWELGPSGPFDRWPTGLGFERFYGFPGAEASQFEPALYDQTTPIEPYVGRDDYHLTEDLVDRAIEWVHRVKAHRPDRPFLCYLAPGAVHTPLQVPDDWRDRFVGRFDAGWDALRDEIYERQLELGVIPPGTINTRRPDEIPSWDDYPDRYKPVASRLMEVFCAFLAHTDHQVGRLVDALQALGEWDDTLFVYITGDNGASAEGTIHGAWSAPSFQNGVHEDPEWLLEHIDDFGTVRCECHYNVGWAWAQDAPFQWMKQVASHLGGTRNGMAVSWPRRILDAGGLRTQFHHVTDIAPTILEVAGIAPPVEVGGVPQAPFDGTSMAYSFDDPDAPSTHGTQYFEILGNRGIYHDGFLASCYHGRPPWIRMESQPFDGPQENWELYDLRTDFSQGVDLADEQPERLAALQDLFDAEARRNGVYPMRDPGDRLGPGTRPPSPLGGVRKVTYTTDHVRMPERSVINVKNRSFEMVARLEVSDDGCPPEGVVVCQGGNLNGWTLYLDGGRPTYHYNLFGHERWTVAGEAPLSPGAHEVRVLFDYDGGFGKGGTAHLFVDGGLAATGRIEQTVPVVFSASGETFDVGVDTGAPVGPYPRLFPCTAGILDVTIELLDELDAETLAAIKAGELRAGLAGQ
ncbi:MAG: arylsulfatase [Acidimicrobiales bacterium]|jgi:arylsulfatase|nr:arylsulfatase [Acidimicrobiales bacterium]MDP7125769.1 arylsulfatase [Acidimicrobiales bacterium]MDP7353243.1 arylsulfatase [Acidimicrobiales bacterium]MDP7507088.1 arylsulfatase [Acidimicrobiales bacterium]|tara:strand:+ start:1204 stop:3696 length:2493 start_codon:yes stop_codon:yes gene_type:complete